MPEWTQCVSWFVATCYDNTASAHASQCIGVIFPTNSFATMLHSFTGSPDFILWMGKRMHSTASPFISFPEQTRSINNTPGAESVTLCSELCNLSYIGCIYVVFETHSSCAVLEILNTGISAEKYGCETKYFALKTCLYLMVWAFRLLTHGSWDDHWLLFCWVLSMPCVWKMHNRLSYLLNLINTSTKQEISK